MLIIMIIIIINNHTNKIEVERIRKSQGNQSMKRANQINNETKRTETPFALVVGWGFFVSSFSFQSRRDEQSGPSLSSQTAK